MYIAVQNQVTTGQIKLGAVGTLISKRDTISKRIYYWDS